MEIWQVLLDVVVLLGGGALLGGLCERFRLSAIVGYLVAGVLLGPNALHVVESADAVLAVSELGVALLLFAIGLEFSWERLRVMGRTALRSGWIQILGTTAFGALVALLLGLGLATSVTLGAICALSSTACVLRVLTAEGELESVHGERALGILLVQDMAVVPLVLLVSILADGGNPSEMLGAFLRALGIGIALVAGLYLTFNHVVPGLLHTGPVHSNRELTLLVAVVSGLGSGVVAHALGVSPALGAFVAGLILAESPFAVQVRAEVSSLKTLLLTLFFTAMGMLSDPGWILSHPFLVAAAVLVVVVCKAAIVFLSLRLLDSRGPAALATGISLGQIGEFSFVLAGIARGRLLSEDLFALVISTAVITMLLTPFLVTRGPDLASRLGRRTKVRRRARARRAEAPPDDVKQSIVIGFGPAGRIASERIAELGYGITVIDQNPGAVRDARRLGYRGVTGDARYAEVLEHARLARAATVVVTVPSPEIAGQIVRFVRETAPGAELLVRARFHRSVPALTAAGADLVIDEEQEVGRNIARACEAVHARFQEKD